MPSDFSIFDGQELVSYSPVSGSPIEDVPVLRRPLTQSRQRNVERYVELEATDVIFHFDAVFLSPTIIAVGDTFQDQNNVTYTILFLEHQALDKTVAAVGRPSV